MTDVSRRRRPAYIAVLIGVLVVAAVLAVVSRDSSTSDAGPVKPTPQREISFPGIWPESSASKYDRAVEGVASGHQPWRLDASVVARTYLADQFSVSDPEVGSYEADGPTAGWVNYKVDKVSGQIRLDRPGGPKAPFVVTALEADGFAITVADSAGVETVLRLDVVSTIAAKGTVRVSGFDSDWRSNSEVLVAAGETAQMTIGLDDPTPDAVLVTAELAGADGQTRTAQFPRSPSRPILSVRV